MKRYYHVAGMHCRSCEIMIEQRVCAVPGITKISIDHRTGALGVTYADGTPIDDAAVARAVRAAGYRLGTNGPAPFLSRNVDDWYELIMAGCFVFLLFLGYKLFGLDRLTNGLAAVASPTSAVVIGLVAGVSTCMALIGGLVLSASAAYAQRYPGASAWQKFQPHIAFNAGLFLSFAVLGGVIGSIGSIFRLNAGMLGSIIIAAGLSMFVIGIKLSGVTPRLQSLTLPTSVARLVGLTKTHGEYRFGRTFLLGGTTFFVPCAFTQMMQVFAVSTGSFVQGALVMSAFAVGTAPGLLGVGGLAAVMRGEVGRMFLKTAGVAVILFGLWNISNGWNLTGITLANGSADIARSVDAAGRPIAVANVRGDKQYITTEQNALGYNPNYLRVKAGIPVVWTINSTNSYTCAASISIPAFGILQNLQPGPNVLEFTPTKAGRIKFSCAMGMITGSIDVTNQ